MRVPSKESFEKRIEQLEGVVKKLESAELPLEDALKLFEQGIDLSRKCRQELEEAETRVEILLKKGQAVEAAPMDEEA
jgi:exodeoxyribonuclease VII small subunit